MEIIKKGLILPEEQLVADKLQSLPDLWWCLGGDDNRFIFKKGTGTQVDFIVINPKGIFIIDAKNINTIELTAGDTLRFYSASGKQVRKSTRRENPVEDVIHEKYQAKDWLKAKGLPDLLGSDNKELTVFIHGLVVIANEQNVLYKNCSLEKLSYNTHKYKTLIPLSKLNKAYFDNINLPPNCNILTKEDMWLLFKIFYNPSLSITKIVHSIKNDADKIFEEKQVFIEKMRLIETDNTRISSKLKDLKGTRNDLMSLNQELQTSLKGKAGENEQKLKLIEELEKENSILKEDKAKLSLYKEQTYDYKSNLAKLEEVNTKASKAEKENKKLHLLIKDNKALQNLQKNLKRFKISSTILLALLISLTLYLFMDNKLDYSLKKKTNSTLTQAANIYPTIEELHNKNDFTNLIKIWEEYFTKGKRTISSSDFHIYDKIFYYAAFAYLSTEDFANAIKYFDVYSELIDGDAGLRDTYLYRSVAHIGLNTELDRAILDLKKALRINKEHFNNDYKWAIQIIWSIGMCNAQILKTKQDAKRKYYSNNLKVKSFYLETIKYFKIGRNLASSNNDITTQANFQIEMGHVYRTRKNYRPALEQFKEAIILLQSSADKQNEKIMLTMNTLGSTYAQINKNNLAKKYYKDALDEIKKVNNISSDKRKVYEAEINRNLGSLLLRTKHYKEALEHLQKALSIATTLNLTLDTYKKPHDKAKKLYEEQ